eukprot:g1077.t1
MRVQRYVVWVFVVLCTSAWQYELCDDDMPVSVKHVLALADAESFLPLFEREEFRYGDLQFVHEQHLEELGLPHTARQRVLYILGLLHLCRAIKSGDGGGGAICAPQSQLRPLILQQLRQMHNDSAVELIVNNIVGKADGRAFARLRAHALSQLGLALEPLVEVVELAVLLVAERGKWLSYNTRRSFLPKLLACLPAAAHPARCELPLCTKAAAGPEWSAIQGSDGEGARADARALQNLRTVLNWNLDETDIPDRTPSGTEWRWATATIASLVGQVGHSQRRHVHFTPHVSDLIARFFTLGEVPNGESNRLYYPLQTIIHFGTATAMHNAIQLLLPFSRGHGGECDDSVEALPTATALAKSDDVLLLRPMSSQPALSVTFRLRTRQVPMTTLALFRVIALPQSKLRDCLPRKALPINRRQKPGRREGNYVDISAKISTSNEREALLLLQSAVHFLDANHTSTLQQDQTLATKLTAAASSTAGNDQADGARRRHLSFVKFRMFRKRVVKRTREHIVRLLASI